MTSGTVGPFTRQLAQRAALGSVAIALLLVAMGSLRLLKLRHEVEDAQVGVSGRKSRLADNAKVARDAPKAQVPDAFDRSRAVSKLRSTLATLATKRGFVLEEYQASTEELPYLTVYAADNKDPGWMQVPVRVTLSGHAPVLAAALPSLGDLDVPFEIDNVELTRHSTDNSGMAVVSEQIQLRLLIYRGEA